MAIDEKLLKSVIAEVLKEMNTAAVSYTHLAVYKRQGYQFRGCCKPCEYQYLLFK